MVMEREVAVVVESKVSMVVESKAPVVVKMTWMSKQVMLRKQSDFL